LDEAPPAEFLNRAGNTDKWERDHSLETTRPGISRAS